MTDLFEKATFGTALLFVAPMTGAYAVMRLVFPIAPDWALQSIAIVSLVTAVYAGCMTLVQHEARRFFLLPVPEPFIPRTGWPGTRNSDWTDRRALRVAVGRTFARWVWADIAMC